jgi:hypothetical protein
VVDHNGKLYLAAGDSDFLAEFDKAEGGTRGWVRDTSVQNSYARLSPASL